MKDKKNLIEAILFLEDGGLRLRNIAKRAGVSESETKKILLEIQDDFSNRGVNLNNDRDKYWFATNTDLADKLFTKDQNNQTLGQAAIETLAIILYRGPITKGELDVIRGVNTQTILRSLFVRKLIDRENVRGQYIYSASADTLAHLGVQSGSEMMYYNDLHEKITELEQAYSGDSE